MRPTCYIQSKLTVSREHVRGKSHTHWKTCSDICGPRQKSDPTCPKYKTDSLDFSKPELLTPEQEASLFSTDGDPKPRADRTTAAEQQWFDLYAELYPEESLPNHPCKRLYLPIDRAVN
jgi:hypothetical protein